MNKAANVSKPFPAKLVIGGVVALFVLTFLGSFGFSLIKNQISGRKGGTDIITAGLTKDQIELISVASAAKTKNEGISTCKKDPKNECFAIVALNFKDPQICQNAPNQNTCKNQLDQLKKDFADLEDGGGTTAITTPGEDDSNKEFLTTCQKGTFLQSAQGKMAVVGKETIAVDGVNYNVCCMEATANDFGDGVEATKLCSSPDQPEGTFIALKKINGRYFLSMSSLVIDGKTCNIDYDDSGIQQDKNCF